MAVTQKVEVTLSNLDRRLLERVAKALEEANKLELAKASQVRYDDQTLQKVYEAMRKVGLDDAEVGDAVLEMQNAGILFRERAKQ